MTFKYQLILLGDKNKFSEELIKGFMHHVYELGLQVDSVIIIDEHNFEIEYKPNCPAFCVYFGREDGYFKNTGFLERLLTDATFVAPVVNNLKVFRKSTPALVHNINGFQLESAYDLEPLLGCIFEGLGLLRLSRRLFISYKRDESSKVAVQLFEQFEDAGFDVFLDTHSIRPGEPFQEELWHRMADTDVIVLLNSPEFLKSPWTTLELAQANTMSIGIFQLIWPDQDVPLNAKISIPFKLADSSFGNDIFKNEEFFLSAAAIKNIISEVESLRVRSLAARQDNLTSEFISAAKNAGAKAYLQPQKFIIFEKESGEEIIFVPTVGVPQAFTYNRSVELVSKIKSPKVVKLYLLYNHLNIRQNWLNHLSWLDDYLPIKTLKITDVASWIKKNI
jgi:hypothetical protein